MIRARLVWSVLLVLTTAMLLLGCGVSRKKASVVVAPAAEVDLKTLKQKAEKEPQNERVQLALLKGYLAEDSVDNALEVADRLEKIRGLSREAQAWLAVARLEGGAREALRDLVGQLSHPDLPDSMVKAIAFELGHPYAVTRIADLSGDAAFPYPSPDGKKVAFQWNQRGNWDIYVLTLRDRGVRAVVTDQARDESPCFSPDGRSLAFTSTRNDTSSTAPADQRQRDIFVVGLDGSKPTCLVCDPADDWYPRFAPDGKSLFFVSERGDQSEQRKGQKLSDLYRLYLGTSQLERLTENDVDDTAPWPTYDGRVLFFARNAGGLFSIFAMDLRTSRTYEAARPVEFGAEEAGAPSCWASRLLVFVGRKGKNYDLYLLDLQTKAKARLTRHPAMDQAPVFDATGRYVYFHSNREGRFQLYRIDLQMPATRAELVSVLRSELDELKREKDSGTSHEETTHTRTGLGGH